MNSVTQANSSNRKDASNQVARFLAESVVSIGLSHDCCRTTLIIGGIAAWAANKANLTLSIDSNFDDKMENFNNDTDPFPGLENDTNETLFGTFKISSTAVLDTITTRSPCSECDKSVKYFCYRCFVAVGCSRDSVPRLKLPIKIDIIKHEEERNGKSTAIHAKILAPDDIMIYSYQNIPKFENYERLLLLFPGPDAKKLDEIPRESFDKLLVIDGTWHQATNMIRFTPEFSKIRKVTIKPCTTLFWRFQNRDKHYLATIEAIYYVLKEYHEAYDDIVDDVGKRNGYDGRGKKV
ncbi:11870_t:CDS:2 [Ambispora leptoticha]|uniref:tRNA-uridine aminocarboxypropyltransferase 1 n=1 Tax=Ambispora leptoticha TaxID=144679 RepID=A0A9N8ZT55_9GLOM|nr:11870_t:CDS:2 [Ambispora leptoticha]